MSTVFRSSDQPPSRGMGSLVIVALVSVFTSVVTSGVMVHYGWWPSAKTTPALKIVVTPKITAPKAKSDDKVEAPVDQGVEAFQKASEAAGAVLNAISTVRTATPDFVGTGPGQHNALNNNFLALETASNNLLQVSGSDPEENKKVIAAFTAALNNAMKRSAEISTRDNETEDVKSTASQVAATLGQIKDSL